MGGGRAQPLQWAVEAAVIVLALAWIAFLISRPVYIRVGEISTSVQALRAEALSGVRGQTFIAPTDRLSRVDFWMDTEVQMNSWISVEVQIAADPKQRDILASGTIVFDRTRVAWPVQAHFSPGLIPAGTKGYLRLMSLTNTPKDHLFYLYSRSDVYPDGEFLDFDRVEVGGQDLLFTLYRSASFPKPLAWGELLLARVAASAERASVQEAWLLAIMLTVIMVSMITTISGTTYVVSRIIPLLRTPLTVPSVGLGLAAITLFVLAWDEAPVGKVMLYLMTAA